MFCMYLIVKHLKFEEYYDSIVLVSVDFLLGDNLKADTDSPKLHLKYKYVFSSNESDNF